MQILHPICMLNRLLLFYYMLNCSSKNNYLWLRTYKGIFHLFIYFSVLHAAEITV